MSHRAWHRHNFSLYPYLSNADQILHTHIRSSVIGGSNSVLKSSITLFPMVASDLSLDFSNKGSRSWQAAAERWHHFLSLDQAQSMCFKCTISSESYLNKQISGSLARRKKCRGRSSHSHHKWPLTCFTTLPGFLGGSVVKNPPAKQEMSVRSRNQEDPLEKEISLDSSILAWRIPWTGEPGATVHGVAKSQTWQSGWTTTILPKSLNLFE